MATGAVAGGISIVVEGGLARVIPTAGGNDPCRPFDGMGAIPGEVMPRSRLMSALRAASHLISSSSDGAQSLNVRFGVITWNVCCHGAVAPLEAPPAVEEACAPTNRRWDLLECEFVRALGLAAFGCPVLASPSSEEDSPADSSIGITSSSSASSMQLSGITRCTRVSCNAAHQKARSPGRWKTPKLAI